jgi:hypothetical protein
MYVVPGHVEERGPGFGLGLGKAHGATLPHRSRRHCWISSQPLTGWSCRWSWQARAVDGYHPALGFGVLPALLTETEAAAIAATCWQILASAPDHVRDKAHSGTRWLADVAHRVPAVADLVRHPRLVEAVEAVVGPNPEQVQTSFRCPMPGFGGQRLHADGVAKLDDGPDRIAVAIVALCTFTPENGSTRVIPGSHRLRVLRPRPALGSGEPVAHTAAGASAHVESVGLRSMPRFTHVEVTCIPSFRYRSSAPVRESVDSSDRCEPCSLATANESARRARAMPRRRWSARTASLAT